MLVLAEGCYYMQAVGGHMEVMRKRRPMPEVIADDTSSEELKDRLQVVQEAREFAVQEMLLPDNGSYRSYADLERDYVVWNVFAAPEFSLAPMEWCFPVAGCVAYKGYFSKDKAERFARKLKDEGYDVIVGGVAAYSTLGRFDDPVLNTMMRWSDLVLLETVFHELAHQKIYAKGDSAFNESFATAVAEIGLERWLQSRGQSVDRRYAEQADLLDEELRDLIASYWIQLEHLYAADMHESEKRSRKEETLNELSTLAQQAVDRSGIEIYNWLAPPLNNAQLVSIGLYESEVPFFRALLDLCNDDLVCFYEEAAALAELDFEQRQEEMSRQPGSTRSL